MRDPRYRVGLAGMNQQELGAKLREAIRTLEAAFPDTTIALFVFDRPPSTNMGYIASANREDVAAAVGTWAARMSPKNN